MLRNAAEALLVVAQLLLNSPPHVSETVGGQGKIKTGDLVFLVIPLLLVALATGKLKGLDMFGVKADLSALWAAAAQKDIEDQVARSVPAKVQDAVRVVEIGPKGGFRSSSD